jgi:hypothetical protein
MRSYSSRACDLEGQRVVGPRRVTPIVCAAVAGGLHTAATLERLRSQGPAITEHQGQERKAGKGELDRTQVAERSNRPRACCA